MSGGRLRGARFPLAVFVVWRAVHAVVVLAFGGGLAATTRAFDANFYLSVLRDGYQVPPGGYAVFSNVPFFPGVPWVTSVVQLVVPDEGVAVWIVANAAGLACFVAVWGVSRAWTGDDRLARRMVVALALMPTSHYLWMYYSEGLLISTTAFAAWAAARNRTGAAVVSLAVAGTARVLGVVAGPVLAVSRVWRLRRVDATAVLYLAASMVGFGAVLLTQHRQIGDPLGWLRAQAAWGRELAPPWQPIAAGVRIVIDTLPDIAEGTLLDLVTVALVGAGVVALVLGVRRGRWPLEAALLAGAAWFVPLCSRLVSSQVRFALVAWPVLLVVAHAWPRLGRTVRVLVVLAAVVLSVVLLRRLALGVFTA